MQLDERQLSQIHHSIREEVMLALRPYADLQETWKAGKKALQDSKWTPGGDANSGDDTADAFYESDFPKDSGKANQVIAGIMAAKLLLRLKCAVRGVDGTHPDKTKIIISNSSAENLVREVPGMQLADRMISAGLIR